MIKEYIVIDEFVGIRLDVFLAAQDESISRASIQKMIAEELITVNNIVKRANYKLKLNDQIKMTINPPQN